MSLGTYVRPDSGGLLFSPPDEFIPESQKGASWFLRYARWIVATFYNQPKTPFSLTELAVQPGVAQEAIENWSYIFLKQPNYDYKFITQDYSGAALPAVWLPGGRVSSLYDHLSGILLQGIENTEVTAQNLSKDVTSKKANMLEKLMIKYETDAIIRDMMPEGIEFDPVNDPEAELNTPGEIEKYVQKWQDKYSIVAEKLGKSQMIMDDLKEKFLRDGQHQFVGGLSGILTEVENGEVVNTVIPGFELIWDNRQDDPFGEKSLVGGYVKHSLPYLEVIRRYGKQMNPDDLTELRALAVRGYDNMDDFTSYYNTGMGRGNFYPWWSNCGTSQMTLAVATVYFIAPRDFRYQKSSNKYGAKRIVEINDEKDYQRNGETVKGVDLPGDYEGWDLYTATLIGNKYIVNYGLAPNVLRQKNGKGKPLLPITTFCSNMVLNQGKSLVSKLRPLQDRLDMYAFKIQEKVANDWGKNYVFNGNKFPGIKSTQAANELKSLHVTVSVPSGEADDPYAAQRLVEQIDMTLDSNIISYLELSREIEAQMNMITSVSQIALGQQGAVIGKGVQENTINQNSYGTATIMWGLMKHFNQVLQKNVNLKQMLYQFTDTVEESLIIGDEGSYLLKILNPREFGTQPLQVFLEIASTLDPTMRSEIRTIALSAAQNGMLDLVDYIEHVLMPPTMNQTVKGLKESMNKKNREDKERMGMEQQMATQSEAVLIKEKTMSDAALIQLKEDNANWRTKYAADMDAMQKQLDRIAEMIQINPGVQPPPSPLQAQMAAASQPQEQVQTNQI